MVVCHDCIIRGCSAVFAPLFKYIFDLSLSPNTFQRSVKKVVIVPILKEKKGNSSSVSKNRKIYLLNNFSKVSVLVIHTHMSRYFMHKLNPSQHGFSKANLQLLIWYPIYISFPFQLVLNVKFILFILTLSALLLFSRILVYFTNLVSMGFLTVT